MAFIGRFRFYEPKPTKGYLCDFGVLDAFEHSTTGANSESNGKGMLENAESYLSEVIRDNAAKFKDIEFLVSILWGDKGLKVADVFGYAKIDAWPGNPEVYNWVIKNGVYRPDETCITCANSIRMLGMEETARRGTKSLEEYMKLNPVLGDLQPTQG